MTGHGIITSPLSFQVLVDGSVTTVVLEGLSPLTEYLVNVYSVVDEVSSEPLKGTETTCKCSSSSLLCLPLPNFSPRHRISSLHCERSAQCPCWVACSQDTLFPLGRQIASSLCAVGKCFFHMLCEINNLISLLIILFHTHRLNLFCSDISVYATYI